MAILTTLLFIAMKSRMEITEQKKLFGCKRVNILLHGSGIDL
jgi:hypothetical protein